MTTLPAYLTEDLPDDCSPHLLDSHCSPFCPHGAWQTHFEPNTSKQGHQSYDHFHCWPHMLTCRCAQSTNIAWQLSFWSSRWSRWWYGKMSTGLTSPPFSSHPHVLQYKDKFFYLCHFSLLILNFAGFIACHPPCPCCLTLPHHGGFAMDDMPQWHATPMQGHIITTCTLWLPLCHSKQPPLWSSSWHATLAFSSPWCMTLLWHPCLHVSTSCCLHVASLLLWSKNLLWPPHCHHQSATTSPQCVAAWAHITVLHGSDMTLLPHSATLHGPMWPMSPQRAYSESTQHVQPCRCCCATTACPTSPLLPRYDTMCDITITATMVCGTGHTTDVWPVWPAIMVCDPCGSPCCHGAWPCCGCMALMQSPECHPTIQIFILASSWMYAIDTNIFDFECLIGLMHFVILRYLRLGEVA